MLVIVGSPDSLGRNFWQPEVLTQIARNSDTYENGTTSAKTIFESKISYNRTP